MTVREIYIEALAIMGYDDNARIQKSVLPIVNAVYADVCAAMCLEMPEPLINFNSDITLPKRAINAMCYGVAAQLCVIFSDSETQIYFAEMFDNARRRLASGSQVIDILP